MNGLKTQLYTQRASAAPEAPRTSAEGQMLQAEIDAMQEVLDQALPLINDPHRDFEGFLPAVFAYRAAEGFNRT
jgi:hypothetical protein